MKPNGYLGRWRSDAAEGRFRRVENELWKERWPDPPEAIDVDSTWGTTRVYRWDGEGEPVVFFHGMGGTSLMWSPFVAPLAPRPLYAVDTLGDVGRGVHRRAFRGVDDMAAWVAATLGGLGLAPAHLVGNSYGAWLALNAALRAPACARSLSLLDPAGMAPIDYRFFLWGAQVFLAAYMPKRVRLAAARRLGMPLLEDKRIMRMAFAGQINHPFRLPISVLEDNELRQIKAPTLLLIGSKSEIYSAEDVADRARRHMPLVTVTLIPGVGHSLPVDPKAEAPRRVAEFLQQVTDMQSGDRKTTFTDEATS